MRAATLHTARWVLPMSRGPIDNGGVAVVNGRVAAVGAKRELGWQCKNSVDHGEGVIMPALVNCHCHLELSALRYARAQANSFTDWLGWVVTERAALSPSEVRDSAARALSGVLDAGTGLVADITNTGVTSSLLGESCLHAVLLHERFGLFSTGGEVGEIAREESFGSPANGVVCGLAAHAPYSTSASLMRALKREAKRAGRLFSIHLGESADEVRFLRDGGGPLRDFIAQRGVPVEKWRPPGVSPVEYAQMLGVLDEGSLVVHAVELSLSDMEILAASRASVCFCPRSNANLGLNKARLEKMLGMGIRAGLGTDSLASNHDLSIFGEMSFVAERFPGVAPKRIVEMATIGGAEVLGAAEAFGAIEPGKPARLIFVPAEEKWPTPFDAVVALHDTNGLKWIGPEED